MDPNQLSAEIKQKARSIGFDLCGIAAAAASAHGQFLRDWLEAGRHGEMAWMASRVEEREDVQRYFPGARSVVCCAMSYNVELAEPPAEGAQGRIARYALGDDYHEHMKRRLFALADWLRQRAGGRTRACVDTAPVLEREWAARCGVGWQGKNTCTLHTALGSYLLLGEIITTLDVPPDQPAVDRCGTCTRCLDACPSGALTPYRLDATRCLSYWNIEFRGEIPREIAQAMGDRLFGCDICQEVCPWNSRAPLAGSADVQPRFAAGTLDVRDVLAWTEDDYRRELRGSAMKRVKLPQLQRNARIVLDHFAQQPPRRSAGEP
jgi:epoxyqueuosine reductase